MDLMQFILLCVERDMISNKFSLDIFYTAFKEAQTNCGIETGQTGDLEDRFVLVCNNFYLAMTNLAKALYAHEENPFEAMFTKMLVDQKQLNDNSCKFFFLKCILWVWSALSLKVSKWGMVTFSVCLYSVVGGRSPKMGGDTIHILSEDSIKVYLVYMDQLKSLFTKFIHQNWNEQRRVSWEMIDGVGSAYLINELFLFPFE